MKNPTPSSVPNRFAKKPAGFTLVEVLTVIAIISILMTAGAIGLGNLTAGKGTSSAIATTESLFEEARTIAISKRCKTRLLVDINSNTSENYLRRVVIAHEKLKADGSVDTGGGWVLASRGYTMPTGTFFSREYSKNETGGKIKEENMTVKNEAGTNMANYAGKYASYEFNGEGIFNEPGASFIIAAGVRPKNSEPRTAKGAERDFAGFIIWRNGRTSSYRSPDQMGIPASVKNF